jgi:hypothetical protein
VDLDGAAGQHRDPVEHVPLRLLERDHPPSVTSRAVR